MEDLAEYAIKTATDSGASFADVRIESTESTGFLMKNSVPEMGGFEKNTGIGIRIIKDHKLSFVSSNILTKEKINDLIKRAIKQANNSDIYKKLSFADEKAVQKDYEVKEKIKLADIGPDEKMAYLTGVDKSLLNCKADVVGRYLSLSDSTKTKLFMNSEGTKIKFKIPKTGLFYFLTIKEGNEVGQKYWQHAHSMGWEATKIWNLQSNLPTDAEIIRKNILSAIKAPTGKLDVVTGSEVTGIIAHEASGHPYEADRILGREAAQAGESFITKDMINFPISNECVNVVDDPIIEGSSAYFLYDDEGVKTRRKYLIKEGKINEFLQSKETAEEMGVENNASARASAFNREQMVRMSNTFFLPGEHSDEELFEDIKKGVLIKNFMEWNIDDVRLNQKYVGNESYLIENGEIKSAVKNPILEIDTFTLFKAIDAVGKTVEMHAATCGKAEPMQGIPVWMGGPGIRIRNVRLGDSNG